MDSKLYSLTGIIFQKNHAFGIAHMPGVGVAATITPVMIHGVFQGVVGIEEDGTYSGQMKDHWGTSEITELFVSKDVVSFRKAYPHRPPIFYNFEERKENTWIGSYVGADCGSGEAKLSISPLDASFFELP